MGMTVIRVPARHEVYAAAYRYGHTDGAAGKKHESRSFFVVEGAWDSYCAGYIEGTQKRKGTLATAQADTGSADMLPLFREGKGASSAE